MAVKIHPKQKERWRGFSPEELKALAKRVRGMPVFDRESIVFEAKQRKARKILGRAR